ncbi:tRNA (adenosine(37)-N6)-threonylcarbamoyltransferase complex dimerization subunit type 1 TsaB [Longirhabdus pacifica]|uniref:tRNA (adenosine(37)-N6)-threonylcarbamoyltransferase complex dimerization subunit type 1 TsaB n=1 Tax=Longirhabdus pacifica TaxID=2305227 RepID=UPI0010088C98|nr:tRNA (adenosine(37)-N6)-threonylcarbamoyltransferase complex dimerization subunit type 1 TsaB [Longirhabdus pacifica]
MKHKQKTWLALDCSTSSLTVAVLRENEVLSSEQTKAERNHSIRLVPQIQEQLQACDLTLEDIDGIIVGQGPGSYTGVRIAVTVAKTLAWSKQIPLIGVSSLASLARGAVRSFDNLKEEQDWIVPLMDARRGRVYTSLYQHSFLHPLYVEDGVMNLQEWLQQLNEKLIVLREQQDDGDASLPSAIYFVGDTALFEPLLQDFQTTCAAHDVAVYFNATTLDAVDVALIGQEGKEVEQLHTFTPNYAQLAEAEAKWIASQSNKDS